MSVITIGLLDVFANVNQKSISPWLVMMVIFFASAFVETQKLLHSDIACMKKII
jgi:hypothetical protein